MKIFKQKDKFSAGIPPPGGFKQTRAVFAPGKSKPKITQKHVPKNFPGKVFNSANIVADGGGSMVFGSTTKNQFQWVDESQELHDEIDLLRMENEMLRAELWQAKNMRDL